MFESKFSLAGVAGICLPQYSMSIARNHLQHKHCLEYRTMRETMNNNRFLCFLFNDWSPTITALQKIKSTASTTLFFVLERINPPYCGIILQLYLTRVHMTECGYTAAINGGRKQQVNLFLNEILKCCHLEIFLNYEDARVGICRMLSLSIHGLPVCLPAYHESQKWITEISIGMNTVFPRK